MSSLEDEENQCSLRLLDLCNGIFAISFLILMYDIAQMYGPSSVGVLELVSECIFSLPLVMLFASFSVEV